MPQRKALMPQREALLPKSEELVPQREALVPQMEALVLQRKALVPYRKALEPHREALWTQTGSFLPPREAQRKMIQFAFTSPNLCLAKSFVPRNLIPRFQHFPTAWQ